MIAWFTRNGVAANLLLAAIVLAGLHALVTDRIPLEVFPEFEQNQVSISVSYRGTTPEDVEQSIVMPIEEAIADVEGIRRILSSAGESGASITIEVSDGYDRREVREEIQMRVDSVAVLPAMAERPEVSLSRRYRSVISVILSGDLSENDLRRLGEQLRDDIANLPEITSVELQGVRLYEIGIEISEEVLQRHRLTFDDVAQAIRQSSVDVPAGVLRTDSGEVPVRLRNRAYWGEDFANITVVSNLDGTRLSLADIATIRDGFDENEFIARFDGRRSVLLAVAREGNQNAIRLADRVKDYLQEIRPNLPDGVTVEFWNDQSRIVKGRLATLVDSAWKSIALVLLVLTLFLRPSLAFWVVVGLPVAFLGAVAVMPWLGVSLNVVSMFAFILVLGVVVDDAIVTGENVYVHQRRGASPVEASIRGTREVAMPVIFGVLTTMLAFVPLMLQTEGRSQWYGQISVIVIAVLAFSLIESKLILPAHLKHSRAPRDDPGWIRRKQLIFARGLEWFADRIYRSVLRKALEFRYLTLALFVSTLVILGSMVLGGFVSFIAFQRVPSDRATARVVMEEGTPFEVTQAVVERLEQIGNELREEVVDADGQPLIRHILSSIGGQGLSSSRRRGSLGQSHLGEITMEFRAREQRGDIDTMQVVQIWRERLGPVIGAKEINFRAETGGWGSPIEVQLRGRDVEQLRAMGELVRERLEGYPTVFDVGTSMDEGRDELQARLRPEGELARISEQDLGRQVRQALFGEEVQRFQRGRDDVRVMLRYPLAERRSLAALDHMRIRNADGDELPFSAVAEVVREVSFPRIQRVDRSRSLSVTADYDRNETDMPALQADLAAFLNQLRPDYPGVIVTFEGEARELEESRAAQWLGVILVAFGLYALLAIPLRSYWQPLLVMSVIPFGLIGAVLGHMGHGLPLTTLSLFGLLALAGVVVNDSLVLVDFINRRRAEGMPLREALEHSGVARFRAIVLTSLTTFAGLLPLISEKSTQAQFLIPMAISLGYGILAATLITLILIPAQFLIARDLRNALRLWVHGRPKNRPQDRPEDGQSPRPGRGPGGGPTPPQPAPGPVTGGLALPKGAAAEEKFS